MNVLKRRVISTLLLGLLLAGSTFMPASQLKAQPLLPGSFPWVSSGDEATRVRVVEYPRSGADGTGKEEVSGSAPAPGGGTAGEDGRLGEVVGSQGVQEAEPAPSELPVGEAEEAPGFFDPEGWSDLETFDEVEGQVYRSVAKSTDIGVAMEAGEGERGDEMVVGEGLPHVLEESRADVSLGLSKASYSYPGQLLAPHWNECLRALEEGSVPSLRAALNRLYEAKLDGGYRNMPDYAALLIRQAYRHFDQQEVLVGTLLAETAYNLAPEYYPVSLSLSRLALKDSGPSFGKYLRWRWVSLKQRFQDFLWQFTTVGKIYGLLLMALYLFFLFLGLYWLGRYVKVLFHFVHERVPMGSFGTVAVSSLLLGTVVVLLFLPGPFWVTVFLGFLLGRFARKWEKVCFSLFLVLWVLSPWVFNQTVCFFSPLSDGTRAIRSCIQGQWNAEAEEALNAAVHSNPGSLNLWLAKALVEKRRGKYEEALRVLTIVSREHPQAASVWNNLGNLHAIQGDIEAAKAAYKKALLYGNGSAAPHYNLSQLLRREFSFLRGAQEFQKARKIDAERVDYFTYIHSANPNRFFMDEEPKTSALWGYAFHRDPETDRAADHLWRSTAAGIPLRQTPWVFLALAGVYVVFVARRRSGQEPFVCSGCGQIVCAKCDVGAEVGGLCSPCYQALYQRENIPKERRHGQIRTMARYQFRRSRKLLILNMLMPGTGFSLLEDKPQGALLLFGFLFLLLVAAFWSAMLPVPMTVWEVGGSVLRILSMALLIVLYVVVQQRFLTKIRSRR